MTYLNIEKVLKADKLINIIVTATGTRKTTYFAKWAVKQALQGKVVLWIRRKKDDISNTVIDTFREEFGEQGGDFQPYITSKGVKLGPAHGLPLPARTYIYFIPLSLHYHYKGLTKIADKMAGIVYDEAIPMAGEPWIGNDTMKEGQAFTKLINIGSRDRKIPIFFLCNPNVLGSWMIQRWFPDYHPDPVKEKTAVSQIDQEAFIYSMPWLGGSRGTVDHFEDNKEQEITKKGVFQKEEYQYITKKKAQVYLCTLIISKREFDLGKYKEKYIISSVKESRRNKKIIVFRRSSLISNPGSVFADKKHYSDWLAQLWNHQKLLFSDATVKNFLKDNIDRETFW